MSTAEQGMTYKDAGVDYDAMDPAKRDAQRMAAMTAENAKRMGIEPLEWTRGESVYLFRDGSNTYGHLEEGLGNKNVPAGAMRQATTLDQYLWNISQCAVGMIVNDGATLAVSPISCAMHLAAGHSDWFKDEKRYQALFYGWKRACDMAGCIWGAGEMPTLKYNVMKDGTVISGSMVGKVLYRHLDPKSIRDGDAIAFLTSSGIHANGVSLAIEIASKLPKGYLTEMDSGRSFGDALLEPTHIYCRFVEDCMAAGIDLHYGVNITGHGWLKLMRAKRNFAYIIETMPELPEVLAFMQQHGPVTDREAFKTLNMGAGFALYLPQDEVAKLADVAKEGKYPFKVVNAGFIEASDKKKVIIEPKGIEYGAEELNIR